MEDMKFNEAVSALFSETCPLHEGDDHDNKAAIVIPAFLMPILIEAVKAYGPTVVKLVEQAAVDGINALAQKLGINVTN